MRCSIDDLTGLVGTDLGASSWVTVTQEDVNAFAEVTGDHGWIHTDVERARASPLGGTIVHGFLTLSLASKLLPEVLEVEGKAYELNYGLDRVRFITPLRVGDQLRLRVTLEDMDRAGDQATLRLGLIFEAPAAERPVCAATWILRERLADPTT